MSALCGKFSYRQGTGSHSDLLLPVAGPDGFCYYPIARVSVWMDRGSWGRWEAIARYIWRGCRGRRGSRHGMAWHGLDMDAHANI